MTDTGTVWEKPPDQLFLATRTVHVWRTWLDVGEASLTCLEQTLDRTEKARAARFRFADHRIRFVARRGMLRMILARYAQAKPDELAFVTNAYGRPMLVSPSRASGLRFSVSHSDDLALYAVGRWRALGVDVERVRDDLDVREICERYFAPGERVGLGQLPPDQRRRSFFSVWTRKEAYVKARGKGLSMPFDAFEVTVGRADRPRLLGAPGDSAEPGRWTLNDLDVGPGYAAAIAAQGGVRQLSCWDLTGRGP